MARKKKSATVAAFPSYRTLSLGKLASFGACSESRARFRQAFGARPVTVTDKLVDDMTDEQVMEISRPGPYPLLTGRGYKFFWTSQDRRDRAARLRFRANPANDERRYDGSVEQARAWLKALACAFRRYGRR